MRYKTLLTILLAGILSSCVQKTYTKTVVFSLEVPPGTQVYKAGLRGENKPLSWEADLPLQPTTNPQVYTATVTYITGYSFAEVKFTVNDQFELENQPNRRVVFSFGDTTHYKAQFNKM